MVFNVDNQNALDMIPHEPQHEPQHEPAQLKALFNNNGNDVVVMDNTVVGLCFYEFQ